MHSEKAPEDNEKDSGETATRDPLHQLAEGEESPRAAGEELECRRSEGEREPDESDDHTGARLVLPSRRHAGTTPLTSQSEKRANLPARQASAWSTTVLKEGTARE